MEWWNQLTPQQRTMLMIGVPIVGVVVLVQRLRGGPPEEPAGPDPLAVGTIAGFGVSTDAIGTGQLAEFETGVTSSLTDLSRRIAELTDKAATTPTPTRPTPPATTPKAAPNNGNLRVGSRGPEVKFLQEMLNRARKHTKHPAIAVDGIFGTSTESAVKAVQRHNNANPSRTGTQLGVTGVVGPATSKAIVAWAS